MKGPSGMNVMSNLAFLRYNVYDNYNLFANELLSYHTQAYTRVKAFVFMSLSHFTAIRTALRWHTRECYA